MEAPDLQELDLLHSNICKALGDVKRIQILYALDQRPLNVTELAEHLEAPQPTVSRHLAILRERGLVTTERDGLNVVYSLATEGIIDIMNQMRGLLRAIVEERAGIVA